MQAQNITLKVPEETLRRVQRLAEDRNMSVAELLVEVLEDLLSHGSGHHLADLPDDEWNREVGERVSRSLERLAAEWERETALSSSITQKAVHPAYQRIISFGTRAIPFILSRLKEQPGHWFWALKAITGEDPVPAESRGDLVAMSHAWLEWGRQHGYC